MWIFRRYKKNFIINKISKCFIQCTWYIHSLKVPTQATFLSWLLHLFVKITSRFEISQVHSFYIRINSQNYVIVKKKKKKKKHEEGKSKNLKKIQQNSTYIEATIATSNSPKGVSYFLRGSAGNLKKFPTTTLRDFIYTTLSRLPL